MTIAYIKAERLTKLKIEIKIWGAKNMNSKVK